MGCIKLMFYSSHDLPFSLNVTNPVSRYRGTAHHYYIQRHGKTRSTADPEGVSCPAIRLVSAGYQYHATLLYIPTTEGNRRKAEASVDIGIMFLLLNEIRYIF